MVVIAKDVVEPECWDGILRQDYPNSDLMVHVRKPKVHTVDGRYPEVTKNIIKKYINCADNREAARKIALASDADRFFFVDSDIVVPSNAISEMMKQPFDVIGGWYRVAHEERYTCGRWVGDNLFINLYSVEPSVVKVDCIGMGCAMFTRRALQDITFHHGTDRTAETWINGEPVPMILGECGALGNLLNDKGYQLYMNGEVVCKHLAR